MRRFLACLTVVLAFGAGFSAPRAEAAEAKPFITAKDLDITAILPPPPADDSAQTKAEVGEILTIQVTRTPEQVARAQADATEDVWRFADVLGPSFTKAALPNLAAFFDRVVETEGAVTDPAKDFWKRPRPHLHSDLVKPVVKLSSSGSYPSGHTSVGTLMGIVLANMVPEKRAEIMARAWEYGNNRVIAGIHYRSDIEAGRIAGSLMAAAIMERDDFRSGFETAKAELRGVLGL